MRVRSIGSNSPLIHSAMSAVHLDDSKNALPLNSKVFTNLHSRLDALSIPVADLPTLIARQKRALRERVEHVLDNVREGDLKERARVLRGARFRMFRVLLKMPEAEHASSHVSAYELRRYVLKFSENKQESHYRDADGVTAQYVMRIQYVLEYRRATSRRPEAHTLQCACNATALDGESGSAFASRLANLTSAQWEEKLAEVYRLPYRLLELVAASDKDTLLKLAKPGTPLPKAAKPFALGYTDAQLLQNIKVHTFGFRWMVSLRDAREKMDTDARELMLLLLFVLYNSKHRFLNRNVGVGHSQGVDVEITRKSDKQYGLFEYVAASPSAHVDAEAVDADRDPMDTRLGRAFAAHRKDPVTGLRIRVKDSQRRNLYTISFHIPSEKYLRLLYSVTDGMVTGPSGEDHHSAIRDMWKEMAKYGIVIGVDCYAGYLRDRRDISTLSDLLRFFVDHYKRDIRKFCQFILQTAYNDIDIQYWLSCKWMAMFDDPVPVIDEEDRATWKWLTRNPDQNIIDLMLAKRMLKGVPEVNGVPAPTKEHLQQVRIQVQHWRQRYAYDPSYSWGAHSGVLRAWYHADNPRKFYLAEKQGIPLAQKMKQARDALSFGVGSLLPKMVALPLQTAKPVNT